MISLKNIGLYWKSLPSCVVLRTIQRRSLSRPRSSLAAISQLLPVSSSVTKYKHSECNIRKEFRNIRTFSPIYSEIKTVNVPPFAESVTEGDLRWVKGVGDQVQEDEPVGEVETDKTTVPVNAPCAGVITELLVEDGTTVAPGTPIFKIQPQDVGAADVKAEAPKPKTEDVAATVGAAATTVAAAASTPSPSKPAPSGVSAPIPSAAPPAPEVPKAPLKSIPVAAIKHSSFISQAEVKVPPSDYSKEITGTRTEQRVKMSRMRLRIAQRLKDAQNTNAMLTTFNEIDMGNIMELRKSIGEAFVKKHSIKLGFMSAFIKASAYALQELPVVNGVIENQEIVYRDYVDISVAVATPKGLVVPVIRNVEGMNFYDIEKYLMALGEKAKTGSLAVEDMDGGTFTISNGGVFGSLLGTPIINPPQSAILGMHAIVDRPVARGGQVVIRPMMFVALTYDHRLIDGREAVTFLRKIKQAVEDPRVMLCGL